MTVRLQRFRSWLLQSVCQIVDRLRPRGIPKTINGERLQLTAFAARSYPTSYEPEKAAFLRRHCIPGTHAIDVGAHFGIFTITMANAVGRDGQVTAFEPGVFARSTLAKTVANSCHMAPISVRPEAVTSHNSGGPYFASESLGDQGNTFVTSRSGVPSHWVPSIALDSLAEKGKIGCIKIDAEGAELEVLKGARLLIRRDHPALIIEVHPELLNRAGACTGDLWDELKAAGYGMRVDNLPIQRRDISRMDRYFELEAVWDDLLASNV